jgi:Tellurite resistance protein TehB
MAHRPRSLQHEYELFVEREIENYKESVPRRVILGIGDEAVQSLEARDQLSLTELLLCEEVDRIIRARLRLATFATWRKRRVKALAEFKKPERWGMRADCAIARTAAAAHEGHVLVAGALEEGRSLYLAANGCDVTTLDPTEDVIERVIDAAAGVGLTGRIRGVVSDLAEWEPDFPISAVVCAAAALMELTPEQRQKALAILQAATKDGGVHVV